MTPFKKALSQTPLCTVTGYSNVHYGEISLAGYNIMHVAAIPYNNFKIDFFDETGNKKTLPVVLDADIDISEFIRCTIVVSGSTTNTRFDYYLNN